MKIILYSVLIIFFAAAAYGIYNAVMQGTFSAIGESITSGLESASEWINDKISFIGSLIN